MGGKDKESGVTVVLKADIHCEGCASKIIKCVRSFDGVETVTIDGQKITVVGKVDPAKLRDKVEQKTHKKVELISPQPKKDGDKKENAGGKENNGGGNEKKEKKKDEKNSNSDDKSNQKKPKEKEPPVTTAVLKVYLHCDGCIQKIYKTIIKTKGYKDMKIDPQKDLVTVTGAMDMKALAELLQKQLKKEVTIVPAKKNGEKNDNGEKKENGGGGGGGAEGDGDGDGGGGEKKEGNKKQPPVGYLYPFMYEPVAVNVGENIHYNPYAAQYHAPQIFSDENPNSCSVM